MAALVSQKLWCVSLWCGVDEAFIKLCACFRIYLGVLNVTEPGQREGYSDQVTSSTSEEPWFGCRLPPSCLMDTRESFIGFRGQNVKLAPQLH
jgi:hypothetical protein